MNNSSMIAIIAARMGSERLPGKTLLPLAGRPVFQHMVERVREAGIFDSIHLATSLNPNNQPLVELAGRLGIEVFQGEEEDVISRYQAIMSRSGAAHCVRFCADNPLTDMETVRALASLHLSSQADYTCVKGLQLQLGLTEAISAKAIQQSFSNSPERESFTIYLRENAEILRIAAIQPDAWLHQSPYRLTLDYLEDYQLLQILFESLFHGAPIPYRDALKFLDENPKVAAINRHIQQKPMNCYWEELDRNLPEGTPLAEALNGN